MFKKILFNKKGILLAGLVVGLLFATHCVPLATSSPTPEGITPTEYDYETLSVEDWVSIGKEEAEYRLDVPIGSNKMKGWFRFGPGGDGGRIYAEYFDCAPHLILSDFDDFPAIEFRRGIGELIPTEKPIRAEKVEEEKAEIRMTENSGLVIPGGNLGIGTKELFRFGQLTIEQGHNDWISLRASQNNNIWRIHNPSEANRLEIGWRDGNTGQDKWGLFVIKNNGNVGIGTTHPEQKLHVAGNFVLVKGKGNEQAYIGGDGVAEDVEVGSFNPDIHKVVLWNRSLGERMGLKAMDGEFKGNIRANGANSAVVGESTDWIGLYGLSHVSDGDEGMGGYGGSECHGLVGQSIDYGTGVIGQSNNWHGIMGISYGDPGLPSGVVAYAPYSDGLWAITGDPVNSWAIWADGDVKVDGGIYYNYAVQDPVMPTEAVEPGDVVIISEKGIKLEKVGDTTVPVVMTELARIENDTKVFGIVAEKRISIVPKEERLKTFSKKVIGKKPVVEPIPPHKPTAPREFPRPIVPKEEIVTIHPGKMCGIVVMGIVDCKVDASYGAIEVGDLLTSSKTPGHAMKAADPKIGSIIGKALEPWKKGKGKIKILVTLK